LLKGLIHVISPGQTSLVHCCGNIAVNPHWKTWKGNHGRKQCSAIMFPSLPRALNVQHKALPIEKNYGPLWNKIYTISFIYLLNITETVQA
jgi:hypothetical protein